MSMKVEFIEIVFHASKVYNLTGKWFFYSFIMKEEKLLLIL